MRTGWELHQKAVLVDAHCDTLTQMCRCGRKFGEQSKDGHVDLPRLVLGGVKLQFMAAYIAPEYKPVGALRRLLQLVDIFYAELKVNSHQMQLIEKYGDIESCLAQHKIGTLLSVEGGEAIEGDLRVLRVLYRLGIRSMGLTWNQRNDLADGVGEARANGGLTCLGRQVVSEMNRLGMVIDAAHMAERSYYDVLETTSQPIIVSHANCRELRDHPRNLSDQQIKSLAENGGVMGISFCPLFMSDGAVSLEDVICHIDHVCQLVGPLHVGFGSDFDGIEQTPTGLEDASCWPEITEALVRRGYQEQHILNILGQNFLRVLRQVLL